MQFAACLCWTVVSSVLAVTVTTTAFSCWNFSRSPTRGFQRLVDIHESPHLQQVKNSVPWESSLPWVPPVIEAKKAASGIRASVWCNASCRAKFPCNNSQLKICFWDEIAQCKCHDPSLFPTEYSRTDHMHNNTTLPMRSSLAVLMAGQTRSFSTALVREYWRLVFSNLKHHTAGVMLFAVLSRVSTNSKEFEGASTFSLKQMNHFLKDLNVTWQAEFPLDCTWNEAAAVVTDPALHFLLSPPSHLRHSGNVGFMNAYRARAVAFDLMLRYETANQMRFKQVLFVRPDIIYDLIPNVPSAIARCPDAAYVFNDIFGGMQRSLAPWYATHVATARSWTGTAARMIPQSTSQEIQRLLGWNFSIGQPPFMPAMHLAIHGVPFWGRALEVYSGDVRCDPSNGLLANMWIIRDQMPNTSGTRTACLRVGRTPPKIDDVRRFLDRLGINASIASTLVGPCQKS